MKQKPVGFVKKNHGGSNESEQEKTGGENTCEQTALSAHSPDGETIEKGLKKKQSLYKGRGLIMGLTNARIALLKQSMGHRRLKEGANKMEVFE